MLGLSTVILGATALASVAAAPVQPRVYGYTSTVYAYSQQFDGRTAAANGDGYKTVNTLDSYDVSACEAHCNAIDGCVFANIYRIYGTTDASGPVIECTAWSQPQSNGDINNYGGQDQGHGRLTKIEWSQGLNKGNQYSGESLVGAILAEAPENKGTYLTAANIGWAYDPVACAAACDAEPKCKYANLWQGWNAATKQNEKPTCALFSRVPADGTDINYESGDTRVTNSWGYTQL